MTVMCGCGVLPVSECACDPDDAALCAAMRAETAARDSRAIGDVAHALYRQFNGVMRRELSASGEPIVCGEAVAPLAGIYLRTFDGSADLTHLTTEDALDVAMSALAVFDGVLATLGEAVPLDHRSRLARVRRVGITLGLAVEATRRELPTEAPADTSNTN